MVDFAWPEQNRGRPRGTYELNVYLVPDSASPGVTTRLVGWLEAHGMVDDYYEVELGWLAPGPRSSELFPSVQAGRRAFEYLIAHQGPVVEFLPNAHTGHFGARCPCGASLDDAVHHFLQLQVQGIEATRYEVPCACGAAIPLARLETSLPTALSAAYLNFCHVDAPELAPEVLAAISHDLGISLRVVAERL